MDLSALQGRSTTPASPAITVTPAADPPLDASAVVPTPTQPVSYIYY